MSSSSSLSVKRQHLRFRLSTITKSSSSMSLIFVLKLILDFLFLHHIFKDWINTLNFISIFKRNIYFHIFVILFGVNNVSINEIKYLHIYSWKLVLHLMIRFTPMSHFFKFEYEGQWLTVNKYFRHTEVYRPKNITIDLISLL